ncbi:MAG: hypothetical protein R3350_03655 [Saprospiraceae bacterium]|nr:hypothetical protein [Saprospiraceae bacterium]
MELFAFCPLPLERLALAGLLLLSSGWMPAATPPVQKCDSPSSTDSVMQLRYRTTSVLCGDLNNADRTNENRGYTEKYFSLKSRGSDFENYFQPANWQVIKKYGDGGVDVTGAPNTILVEGANTVKVEAAPRRLTVVKIVIPAEGYVAFDWSKVGGSTFFSSAIAAGDDTFNLIPSPETQGSR